MINGFNKSNSYDSEKSTHIRLIVMCCVITLLFSVLVIKLFCMQITSGDYYSREVSNTTLKEVSVTAARGCILDKYGRVLAGNKPASVVNIDPSVSVEDINGVLLSVIKLLEENGEELSVNFPISAELPHTFGFDDNPSQESIWKNDLNLDEDITPDEAYTELIKKFEIDSSLPPKYIAGIMAIRSAMYQKRYSKYMPVRLAYEISEKTASAIQERNSEFPCVYVATEQLREYPYAEKLSHILGYTGNITAEELEAYKDENYTANDIVGKDGIEKSFELNLNGTDGTELVEVDSTGKRMSADSKNSITPVAGDNLVLTIDAKLQSAAYDALEKALRDTQISRLSGASKEYCYNIDDVMESIISSNSLHMDELLSAKDGTTQSNIKKVIYENNKKLSEDNDVDKARDTLIECYKKNKVKGNTILLAMIEQGTVKADDNMKTELETGAVTPYRAVLDMLQDGTMTPEMTAMDPCTGSAVVTDIKTGGVLAAVTYPSYDNNEFVNKFNNKYYRNLQNSTLTPMVNRAFTEPRAPGSVFKMITAVAGLEEGFITPNTFIEDKGVFKDAGKPYANCWIAGTNGTGGTHGSVNVSQALEVSCNYFFYSLSYSFGEGKNDADGIKLLNKYMQYFGLNDPTGVEIYELYDSMTDYPSKISGPEYKEFITKLQYPDATETDLKWTPGDTIRTAIGQSLNNYTTAQISKYIATLLNGGTRYKMHLMDNIQSADGNIVEQYTPEVENEFKIQERNLAAIKQGMLLVTTGEDGTLTNAFKDFPIKVGAKSGTAQEADDRSEHTTLTAFVPYENPQIAISVLIPYGNDSATAPASVVTQGIISQYFGLDNKSETLSYNTLNES